MYDLLFQFVAGSYNEFIMTHSNEMCLCECMHVHFINICCCFVVKQSTDEFLQCYCLLTEVLKKENQTEIACLACIPHETSHKNERRNDDHKMFSLFYVHSFIVLRSFFCFVFFYLLIYFICESMANSSQPNSTIFFFSHM